MAGTMIGAQFRAYVAKTLKPAQVDQAFPVIRTIAPDLGLDSWRGFAAATLDDDACSGDEAGRGIMTVQNGRGYIHGLFTYRCAATLLNGRTLHAENLVVLDLFDPAAAAEELLRAMERTARRLNCSTIETLLPEACAAVPGVGSWLIPCLHAAGHERERLRFSRRLDP
ncbi:hypothetical protein [Arenibaculum pallidiluteum]|uniref:hypothetical protein n=1 Tax=Arenibaculum pallidiluteum TaxID=2812559 RepID=UPI001A977CDD|nr:hypothetical protein [Arenibaculum pallidiluteum]